MADSLAGEGGAQMVRTAHPHIIDVLIEERAPRLSRTWAWPMLRPPLYQILNYRRAVEMADAIAPLGGADALAHLSAILNLKLETYGADRIPRDKPFLILANHPTGITDGIAVYDALRPIRPDHMFYANSDAQRVCPRFDDVLIPVEWVMAKRTRERTRLTLKMTGEAIAAGRPIVIFPAGRLARVRGDGRLTDPEWMASAVSIARKYALPIVPCHVTGPHAFWFHLFDKVSRELRDMTLFRELLNKSGHAYKLTFGPVIPPDATQGEPASVSRRIKRYVERVLSENGDAPYDPNGPECAWRDPIDTFAQGARANRAQAE
ncbi:MAG: acyltransferase [Alphaproteobacteria bacterium]|nr:acyltransferase [Alphaproteobacteria bacterium]